MKRCVLKFGGSNLKEPSDLHKLARAISLYPHPPVVVVSALYGITDTLVRAIDDISQDADAIYALIKSLMKQHQRFINAHIAAEKERRRVLQSLSQRMVELERILLGVHYLNEVPDFARDKILSYGERLSSLVLSELLKHLGRPCRESLPETLGLTTDGEFANATVDMMASKSRVSRGLQEEIVTIVPGFYGLSPRDQVTLLGRGGTDYSAAAYAACIDAQSLDIWKDVPGYMSADPKIVERPIPIDQISYHEAAELSYFGAKILHPRTFEPLIEPGIPIRLFNINHFDDQLTPLTTISSAEVVRPSVIKSVTFTNAIGILTLRGAGVGIRPGLLATITSALTQARINIKSVFTSQTSINLLLDASQLGTSADLIRDLNLVTLDAISRTEAIALVAIVGEGIADQPGIAARIFSAVSREEINIRIISLGASTVATYFIVDERDKERSVKAIHQEFFS